MKISNPYFEKLIKESELYLNVLKIDELFDEIYKKNNINNFIKKLNNIFDNKISYNDRNGIYSISILLKDFMLDIEFHPIFLNNLDNFNIIDNILFKKNNITHRYDCSYVYFENLKIYESNIGFNIQFNHLNKYVSIFKIDKNDKSTTVEDDYDNFNESFGLSNFLGGDNFFNSCEYFLENNNLFYHGYNYDLYQLQSDSNDPLVKMFLEGDLFSQVELNNELPLENLSTKKSDNFIKNIYKKIKKML